MSVLKKTDQTTEAISTFAGMSAMFDPSLPKNSLTDFDKSYKRREEESIKNKNKA